MVTIHSARPDDRAAWLRMRDRLWPDEGHGHGAEIDRYFDGTIGMPLEVLIAADENGEALGFVELSIRGYAEDCETDRVAYLEGWYVEPGARRLGVGRALVRAAEEWGRRQGCTEFGSDALVDNDVSAIAHLALGFEETVLIRCFRKSLEPSTGADMTEQQPGGSATARGAGSLSVQIAQSLAEHLERVRGRIHALVDPLSTEQLWQRPHPYGNSIGHLLLHLTGNLSYYIGTQIAGTGYVRDRPNEFADPSKMPKEQTLQPFDEAVELVVRTLSDQSDADWGAPYQGAGADEVKSRLSMFIRCVSHADHHAGQIIYLAKELTRT
jgi:aminoglycoside 6'-N-acetyltransferase I